MQHRSHHQSRRYAGNFFSHRILRFEGVGDDFRQWAVVADRASQHKSNAMPHAGRHDSGLKRPVFDRTRNAADCADDVQRAHLIFVTTLGQGTLFEIDPERCAEKRVLDIVQRERVPAEEQIDKSKLD